MIVTATEFKLNLGKYLALAETEDILLSKNGKVSVKLVNNNVDRVEAMQSLFGFIHADITEEEAREERLSKI
ncbi:MAG: type II toxin-antitoxin system prevent-host-death family antitoxin [Ruminococcus sp.]|nr:type II toxin-antitoxin system prevent-host-death family antitoxin [Ruminococcus sp.]